MSKLFIAAGHGGVVSGLAWSPDGSRLASSGEDGTVRLWDRSLELQRVLTGPTDGWVSRVAWSPDGTRVAGAWRPLFVWDVRSGAVALSLDEPRDGTLAVAWSPDGRHIAFGGYDQAITMCDPANGAIVHQAATPDQASVTALAWSHDGAHLAVGTWSGGVHLWSPRSRAFVAALVGPPRERRERTGPVPLGDYYAAGDPDAPTAHDGCVRGLAWSQAGRLLSAGDEGSVRLWDPQRGARAHQGEISRRYDDERASTPQVAWSPDGSLAIATGGEVVLWSADGNERLRGFKLAGGGRAAALAFRPDGESIAAADDDGRVSMWDPRRDAARPKTAEPSPVIRAAAWNRADRLLAVGAGAHVELWQVERGRVGAVASASWQIDRVVWSPRGDRFAAIARHEVLVWSAAGQLVWRDEVDDWKFALAWSPDGSALAAGGLQSDVDVWDAGGGERLAHLRWEGTETIAWSPDGARLLVGGSSGREVALWNPRTDERIALAGHQSSIWTAAWSPDGSTVATTEALSSAVSLWDARTGAPRPGIPHGQRAVWSPRDGRLATFDMRGALRIWDAASGRILLDPCRGGHRHAEVVWSDDGRYLASCGDREVCVWDATTGREVARFTGHRSDVSHVHWIDEGRVLLAFGGQASVMLHRVADRASLEVQRFGGSLLAWTANGAHSGDTDAIENVRIWTDGDRSAPAHRVDPGLLVPALLADFFTGRPIPS